MNDYNLDELNLIGSVNYLVCVATLNAARDFDPTEVKRIFDNAREIAGDIPSRRVRVQLYAHIRKSERCVDGSLF